jgi:6-phosphogluconolactonase
MKRFTFVLLAYFSVICSSIGQQMPADIMYAGTSPGHGSKGIYVFQFDRAKAHLTELQTVTEKINPNFLAVSPNKKILYAVYREGLTKEDTTGGTVMSFKIDPSTGHLTKLNEQSTMGKGPAHVSVDPKGRFAYVANYGGGNFAIYPINKDGSLGKAKQMIQLEGHGTNPERQESPHVHSVFPSADGRFIYVSSLGLDKIFIYKVGKKGDLTPATMAFEKSADGSGPRHFAFHPNGKFAFSVEEITSTVASFKRDEKTGALTPLERFNMVPGDFTARTSGADLHLSPDGKFLYVSVRGLNNIAIYSVNADNGKLTFVAREDTRGDHPRNFCMDKKGEYVYVANMRSDNIVYFKRDPVKGTLTYAGEDQVPSVACIIQL